MMRTASFLRGRSDLAAAARRLAERAAASRADHSAASAGNVRVGDAAFSGRHGALPGDSQGGDGRGHLGETWEDELSAELSTTKAWAGVRTSLFPAFGRAPHLQALRAYPAHQVTRVWRGDNSEGSLRPHLSAGWGARPPHQNIRRAAAEQLPPLGISVYGEGCGGRVWHSRRNQARVLRVGLRPTHTEFLSQELYFTPVMWPDFTAGDFEEVRCAVALLHTQSRICHSCSSPVLPPRCQQIG